ncbi:multicopper oxidase domain protein, putative [Rhizoctonia solani AG-3 Rhs1AP]|uniref:Multicopper oxidase domain protein, putative n=1 Tax=Rhizoctonia solani AG-3 Rhs1AP TaxID=1086054 RepID=X8J4X4_9AGAM|nr:multicopper oxidase domain protein, putative [Rhizoctonia solani AG-3 Rhs1AP]
MLRPPFPRFFYNTSTTPTTNAPPNNNTYVFVSPVPPPNALGLERSHSPHSVDGSTVPRPRRKNRERRGTENSLPGTLNALEIRDDLRREKEKEQETTVDKEEPELVKDLPTPVSEPTTPTAAITPTRKEPKTPAQPKMEPSPDYQVPFPQVQDGTTRAKRSGDWERDQAALLRSPTLSAHSNTSGSHTTAPTTASTANTSAGALTIPGAYDSGSASGGSGLETTPTRETVAKAKRDSAGSASGNSAGGGGGSNPPSQAGFYSQQQLAQHLPPNPSPIHQPYRATPPPPSTGSPQIQPARAQAGSSPLQSARQPYAPPPPPPTMGSGSTTGSIDSFDTPSLQTARSYPTTAGTTNSPPTLPDSPPPPDVYSPSFNVQHLGPAPLTLSTVANMIQSQPVPISPVHPRPQHRTQPSVLGPTKMQESWTAASPPEELMDEVQDRKDHMRSPRDGAALRGHRGTGGGSLDFKDNNPVASWAQQQQQQQQQQPPQPERQGSVRRPKVVTQSSTTSVPQQPQPQSQPPMTRNATMPITMRYETISPPPIHQHSGLHLDLHDGVSKGVPEKPQSAPAPPRIQTGRGPSPSPNPRGRQPAPAPAPAPAAMTPPYSYDDPYRGRSGSHASSFAQQQQQARAPPPPPPSQQPQWGTRAPVGIVPFNEDLDHDEHEHEPVPPPMHQQQRPVDQAVMDWANHTQSQHPLSHPNQPPAAAPPRGRSRSRGRSEQSQVLPPLMDPSAVFQQQQQQQQQYPPPPQQHRSPEINGRPGGRSPLPAPAAGHGSGSGSSETEDLRTPRSPSVPLPGDNNAYNQRFGGYNNQFSVGPPTVNQIYTQDLGPHNGHGQMYPSMSFAHSQQMLQQMGAGPQGMHYMNGRQMNGREHHQHQQYTYGYPPDMSSSASGSFLDGWSSNQLDSRGYPTHIRPSAPVPPTPSSGTGPSSVISGDIRNGQQGHMTRAQAVMYNPQQQYQQQYNYAQQYAMDPYRAPSVVSSFMASPFSHNPFLPPVEPQSTQSSPSHQPIGLPFGGKRFGGARMGTKSMGRRRRMMEEYRPESTVPNDTASEAETEAKRAPEAETEFETETEMEEVWLEESDDDELENEFHPTYFVNPAKRKRRFEQKWEQMVKLFREIDRETDATMILAAAPPDQHQTHLLLSRSILRDTNFSHIAQEARSVFSDITVARRHQRTETLRRARQERQRKKAVDDRLSAVAHLSLAAGGDNVGSGSDETSVPGPQTDQDLRMALDAARSSLQEMRRVYDEMETRHREESNRRKEESISLEKLLTTLLSSKSVQPPAS